jgi:hypothetical protein
MKVLILLLFSGAAFGQNYYTVTDVTANPPKLQGSMPLNRSMPFCCGGIPPLPVLTAYAQNHLGMMVGQLVYGSTMGAEFWNADGSAATTWPLISRADGIAPMGANQIGDDGSIVAWEFTQGCCVGLKIYLLTPPPAQQIASLQAVAAQLSAELDAANAVIARDNLKLTNANATIVTLTTRVRKDEAAIYADARSEGGR